MIEITEIFIDRLKASPNVLDLDLSARFAEKLLPYSNMERQTKGFLASKSKYDGEIMKTDHDPPLTTSSERKKKKDVENRIFDVTFNQSSTGETPTATIGTDLEQAVKTKLVKVPGMRNFARLSLAEKRWVEKIGTTVPNTTAQNVVTDKMGIVQAAASVVEPSLKHVRKVEQEILMTPSLSTEDCWSFGKLWEFTSCFNSLVDFIWKNIWCVQ